MPHSSGGGSHGGGHHGGSHHSSSSGRGGSSSKNRRRSSTYFNGARHYVYYKKKKPVHYYSDIEITKEYIQKRKRRWRIIQILWACFYLLFYTGIFLTVIYTKPHKLSQTCVDPNQIIDTDAIISDSDEQQIMTQLEEFRDLTGISVTILTVHDEDWNHNYSSLENYAYDAYVTNLNDEKNWLIVYSEPEKYTDYNDWKWEGMQGDDTDPILTDSSTEKFNSVMHKNISRDGFAKAVVESFDYYNDIVMKTSFDKMGFVISILIVGVHASIFYLVFWIFFGSPIKIDEKSIELADPQYTYLEDSCEYCDGLYIHGIHTSCPHCGAVLKPMDRPVIVKDLLS